MDEVKNDMQGTRKEESKSERFIRLAESRVTKARMAISRIAYLSITVSYE